MTKSLLILGRQPALGLAELESLYGADKLRSIRANIAGVELPLGDIDFLRLGGSTRLATQLAVLPVTEWKLVEKFFVSTVIDLLHSLPDEGKLKIGVSTYGFDITPARLNAAGLTLKKAIRAKGRSIRIIPNQALQLNTAQLEHNKLTYSETGREFLLIRDENNGTTILARTVLSQDINFYTLRDRGRPKRDARVGMLPPKLAQIIINLANPSPGSNVLDPFCGTGVLLQEALLMGLSVYGTDLDQRMVDYSKANLDWLLSQVGWLRNNIENNKSQSILLERQDATSFQAHNAAGIETVASETYLGRPYTSQPSEEVLKQTVIDVNVILTKFLQNICKQLPSGAQLCLAIPSWQTSPGKFTHLPLIDRLSVLGYNQVKFEHVRNNELLYYREDQIVARELLVLTRI